MAIPAKRSLTDFLEKQRRGNNRMSIALPYRFMLAAILFALLGMGVGIWMGINGPAVFNYAPVHAHINLVGWVTMFLFGLWYRSVPSTAVTTLASVHFWVAIVGAILLVIGIIGAVAPNPSLDLFVIPGSLLTLASMLIFLWTVWQASQRGL
jgi:cbb3-type cytochrome oxidase subunit 1